MRRKEGKIGVSNQLEPSAVIEAWKKASRPSKTEVRES